MAWDAGAAPSEAARAPQTEPPTVEASLGAASAPASNLAGALRPPAHFVIQRVAERASDERHNSTNVRHD